MSSLRGRSVRLPDRSVAAGLSQGYEPRAVFRAGRRLFQSRRYSLARASVSSSFAKQNRVNRSPSGAWKKALPGMLATRASSRSRSAASNAVSEVIRRRVVPMAMEMLVYALLCLHAAVSIDRRIWPSVVAFLAGGYGMVLTDWPPLLLVAAGSAVVVTNALVVWVPTLDEAVDSTSDEAG